MSVSTYTKSGTKATASAKLNDDVFGVMPKTHELIQQAYVAYQANGRTNNAKTLRRGEVSGGGRKPWKQKGTGRARFGSIRVPIWRGGGITFGPLGEENYSKKISTASKRTAIRQALTLNTKNIIIVETFDCKNGKTAETVQFLDKIGAERNVLLVVSAKDIFTERATSNLKQVKVVSAMYLNVYDIMNADSIVITKKSLEIIHTWLGKTAEVKSSTAKATKETNKETK